MIKEEFSISKSFNNSTIYFVTSVLQKALSFFLLPLYTVYLSTDDYGLVSLILSFFGIVALLITLALNGSISRYYFIYKNEKEKQKQFLGTVVIGIIINCIVWLILLISFNKIVSGYFLQNISFYPYVFVALLSTVTSPVYLLYQTILQIKQKANNYAINSLSFFILAITLNILFIVVFQMGALGMLLANSIPNILFSIYAIYSLIKRKHIEIVFRFRFLKEALKYSIPLVPHILSGTIADFISRNVLYLKTSLSNVGLYNIAFQFGSILDLILSSVFNALLPFTYDALDDKSGKRTKLISLLTLILRLLVIIALIISLFSEELVLLMTSKPEYYPSWRAIPILALAVLFSFLYTAYGTLLFYNIKGTRFIWIASVSGNLTNIGFTLYFTTILTYLTPAIALVIQRVIMFIIVFTISRIIEPVKYELNKMLITILVFIVLSCLGLMPHLLTKFDGINLYFIGWKILVVFLAAFILLRKDRRLIYSFLSTNLNQYLNLRK
ncbi:MAG: hypothetical protein CVU13_10090 [Bacteroidetes bacterium HGW-Bacteroidetes-8]|jgi:O-antigen/teichoic acid export membrane protein|nr:MAG: hypothetical protein CVU13_10090 [Bacteroidetes bacterium HGW-Bacteroidetes-8]